MRIQLLKLKQIKKPLRQLFPVWESSSLKFWLTECAENLMLKQPLELHRLRTKRQLKTSPKVRANIFAKAVVVDNMGIVSFVLSQLAEEKALALKVKSREDHSHLNLFQL